MEMACEPLCHLSVTVSRSVCQSADDPCSVMFRASLRKTACSRGASHSWILLRSLFSGISRTSGSVPLTLRLHFDKAGLKAYMRYYLVSARSGDAISRAGLTYCYPL